MKLLKFFLYPFACLYNLVTMFRNFLFNTQLKKSFEFESNVIGIGNLTIGGAGKTPMSEYLVNSFYNNHKIVVLSRGYGRKTSGYRVATSSDSSITIGDEPMQIYQKFKNVNVVVCEERALAIPKIFENFNPDIIIMDDSFQHRYVKPSLNILLDDFNRPFYKEYLLPMGRLRESRSGASRADIIVVTKCPDRLDDKKKKSVKMMINNYSKAPVFFTKVIYQTPKSVGNKLNMGSNVLLFSGLANNQYLKEYVEKKYNVCEFISFPDHYNYSVNDVKRIIKKFEAIKEEEKCLLTSEKDFVKLIRTELYQIIKDLPFFYIAIKTEFLEEEEHFNQFVSKALKQYS